ncbi:hypothetical protein N7478_001089 [Penicillium angulare]|uniref:uncharacterized protein n=1 Tax=Penicillium angulare TaxID=116970 RepID=UPI002540325F|nr:uncharacterized protein N7478_001089 [Penicillium angulare]KAJ5291838.1 hypothetical protein N7478_001089 [Penicillium angulare]
MLENLHEQLWLESFELRDNSDSRYKNRYIEGLPVLYSSNKFRLSKQRDLCSTLPAQIPILGLSSIRRLTFWWPLEPSIQPHVSRKNGKDYDTVWGVLSQKYTSLTHICIFIDCVSLAKFQLPELFGEGEEAKEKYIQDKWLDGMEKMIEGKKSLEVFELHLDSAVYRVLRSRVKYWLKEMTHQRRVKNKNKDIRYETFKCGDSTITWQGCPDGKYDRPYRGGGSSDISI